MSGLLVITPSHLCDAQLAIAAARAGETGVLDLGYAAQRSVQQSAVRVLAEQAGRAASWGCRWDTLGCPARSVSSLKDLPGQPWPWLVLAGVDFQADPLTEALKQARPLARRVLLEVHWFAQAEAAQEAGFDGLVVKGHEAGGRIGGESTFILLQRLHGRLRIPFWVQGGIGPDTAAAAFLAGAAGVVLGEQLWLTTESPFDRAERRKWSRLDGSEAMCVGDERLQFRLCSHGDRSFFQEIDKVLADGGDWPAYLRELLLRRGDDTGRGLLVPLGQEIAFAAQLAEKHQNVAGVLAAFRRQVEENLRQAVGGAALGPQSPLAAAHGTTYPILQGPMSRVSDAAPFCQAVAEHGGLPFVAVGVMQGPELRTVLQETKDLLGAKPWGVGILGFLPEELRRAQLDAIRQGRPRYAIIAGGHPSQARQLEQWGIAAYLHVPSPGLLKQFLADGARKFILEGRECGGHVGPRTSFALWQSAIDVLCDAPVEEPSQIHVVFAGGIHDRLSAAMVAALAAPLTARGIKIGVLMGSAYLFTKEAVACGAIGEEFQQQVLACQETVLLESGVGYATRCARTPFAEEFHATRRELIRAGKSSDEIRVELEKLNMGRLRLASKGLVREPSTGGREGEASAGGQQGLVEADLPAQRRSGLYMVGQVAALRQEVISMGALHAEVSPGSVQAIRRLAGRRLPWQRRHVRRQRPAAPIAIVGMACTFPEAQDLRRYWENILNCVDATREVPPERWRVEDFYSPDRFAPDKIYCRRGGFLGPMVFDPLKWRMTPASLKSIEPMQLMALEVAWRAMQDAGYTRRAFCRERTSVIFTTGSGDVGLEYCFRTMLRHYLPKVPGLPDETRQQIIGELDGKLAAWTEDSFPGFLANVAASRIANRLDLCGSTYAVDAACASSLAALHAAIQQLRLKTADLVLVGGIDGANNPFSYMSFSKTQALSPRERSTPFDEAADGIVLAEGVAAVLLKRLDDARRDGDKIYALIRGIGTSSDGASRSITAPHPPGQILAIRRAYEDAGVAPASVTLIEAHGTGTKSGDSAELEALGAAFGELPRQTVAVGSVKSMIGHTKTVAGLAGLIKTTLALKHRVLPPTIGIETPNRQIDFSRSPFYLNTETRPWLSAGDQPRRAGLSAFGFGGTNFHVVLEEYTGAYHAGDEMDLVPRSVEIFIWRRKNREEIARALRQLATSLGTADVSDLGQLACAVFADDEAQPAAGGRSCRLAIVARSVQDLRQKIAQALALLAAESAADMPAGIYYAATEPADPRQVCFLYPGQGSQKVNMLRDLVVMSPWAHELFGRADQVLGGELPQPLSRYIYPPPALPGQADAKAQAEALHDTRVAQPALGVVELFATELLRRFGIRPGMVAGHSFGEYAALAAAGCLSGEALLRLSACRGRVAAEAGRSAPGAMAAVQADAESTQSLLKELKFELELANRNAADQTIIAGPRPVVEQAVAAIQRKGLRARMLPVTAAFHTSAMKPAGEALAGHLAAAGFRKPQVPVYSNTLAERYPDDETAIQELLARHIAEPVLFQQQVCRMYAEGARVFLEVGPGRVLGNLVERILKSQPHTTLALDAGGDGVSGLADCLAAAAVLGLPVQLGTWFAGRGFRFVGTADFFRALAEGQPKPTDWILRPSKAEPLSPLPGSQSPPATPKAASAAGKAASAAGKAALRTSYSVLRTCQAAPAAKESAPAATKAVPTPAPAVTSSHNSRQQCPETQTTATLARPKRAMVVNQRSENSNRKPPSVRELLAQNQTLLAQWLDLQKSQLRVTERFLEAQDRILSGQVVEPGEAIAALAPPSRVAPARCAPAASRPPIMVPAIRKATQETAGPGAADGNGNGLASAASPGTAVAKRPSATGDGSGRNGRASLAARAIAAVQPAAAPSAENTTPELPPTEVFRQDLLRVVSERTGYPLDMLDEDLPLESGLGIDSIKAVEIFNSLKQYRFQFNLEEAGSLEGLTRLKTLRQIVDAYDTYAHRQHLPAGGNADRAATSSEAAATASAASAAPVPGRDEVKRYRLKLVAAPLDPASEGSRPLPVGQTILMLGEMPGLTAEIAAHLRSAGCQVREVTLGPQARHLEGDRYEADLLEPASCEKLHELLRARDGQPVAMVLNFLGLSEPFCRPGCDDPPAARTLAQGLFHVFQEFIADLRQTAEQCGGRVINFTPLGGRFGIDAAHALPLAAAGTLGVCKAVSREFPALWIKNVDVELSAGAEVLLPRLLQELRCDDDLLEVGISADGRWRIELGEEPPAWDRLPALSVDADSVILVTGGACGITAAAAKRLAEARPRLVVVGRSRLEEEPADTRNLDADALRDHLFQQARCGSAPVTPRAVDEVLQGILKGRQIRENLRAMEAAGATVEYHAVDVRDAERFGRLVDDIYERYGRLDGVLHGAGIIEDRLLGGKTAESFAGVFRTKVDGALLLARKLRPESLKFLVFFSSVSARFGNIGQADYGAANEVLNKLAAELNRRWPARVVAINWGPWNAGMVSLLLRQVLVSQGVSLIPIDEGIRFLEAELRGGQGPAEVVISCSLDRIAEGTWES